MKSVGGTHFAVVFFVFLVLGVRILMCIKHPCTKTTTTEYTFPGRPSYNFLIKMHKPRLSQYMFFWRGEEQSGFAHMADPDFKKRPGS